MPKLIVVARVIVIGLSTMWALIIVVSVLPMGVEWLKARRKGQVSPPQSARRSRVEGRPS